MLRIVDAIIGRVAVFTILNTGAFLAPWGKDKMENFRWLRRKNKNCVIQKTENPSDIFL